ncbi:NAD kinase 2, mitochondrial [Schistocerca americana]|uniref:NAD kinase 2, mitochondrial n=1 Tax=Schistocerca americana TaxID=7009 RepID=UPI001F4F126D|nr:NAD kinase 2, mitochondrial [Schistocerca americana]XP_049949217.1 NAD kinase 2, mitochondrial [Schistocerca serialis cubense]
MRSLEVARVNFKRALIVTKLSRYEYEKYRYPHLTETELEAVLKKRGSEYGNLLRRYEIHKTFEKRLVESVEACGITTKVVNRFGYNEENLKWADVVVPVGGDGTFILAASKIQGNYKPVIGFNSDPRRSAGYLCLPKKYSADVKGALQKIINGDFRWMFRNRIRITLFGKNIFDAPLELNEEQLREPGDTPLPKRTTVTADSKVYRRTLPTLALNEIFVGEKQATRVSYLELKLAGESRTKLKCTGICVATGTGSTAWHASMNRISEQSISELLSLLKQPVSEETRAELCSRFSEQLKFDPEERKMCYTVRECIDTKTWPEGKRINPRGFVSWLAIRSRCFDGGLALDGNVVYNFDDGAVAIFQVLDEDALQTVMLRE